MRRLTRIPEFMRYLLAGGWNTVSGYAVFAGLYYLLSAHVHYFAIIALSTVIGVTISFTSYKLYVFRTKGNALREYLRFYGVYAVPITLNFVVFPFFIEVVKMNAYLAQAIITAVTTVIGYFGHKHISFAKPRTDPKKDE